MDAIVLARLRDFCLDAARKAEHEALLHPDERQEQRGRATAYRHIANRILKAEQGE